MGDLLIYWLIISIWALNPEAKTLVYWLIRGWDQVGQLTSLGCVVDKSVVVGSAPHCRGSPIMFQQVVLHVFHMLLPRMSKFYTWVMKNTFITLYPITLCVEKKRHGHPWTQFVPNKPGTVYNPKIWFPKVCNQDASSMRFTASFQAFQGMFYFWSMGCPKWPAQYIYIIFP